MEDTKAAFNGKFILRALHLDALVEGGLDLVLGADEQFLYLCDWPNQKRHPQSLQRLAGHFGLTTEELASLGTKGTFEKSAPKKSAIPYKYRDPLGNKDRESLGSQQSFTYPSYAVGENSILDRTVGQLQEYFCGKRFDFELPIRPIGTDFQKKVWEKVSQIGYGELVTYRMIDYGMGQRGALQAVGSAVGSNPISIIIPCHRVLGANSLGGYAAGLEIKKAFLAFEDENMALLVSQDLED